MRCGLWTGPTAGLAPGFVQANLVVVPGEAADEFEEFCRRNPRACPLLERTEPGSPIPQMSATGADLRTDLPRYRVFEQGRDSGTDPTDILDLWQSDLVAFLLGCSFTFESALLRAGVPLRHVELGRNVPMFCTQYPCESVGRFRGTLVVSMRPIPASLVSRAIEVSGRFPQMHGAPVHVGNPQALGISEISRPDFGDSVSVCVGEVPVFWACGVTPQVALTKAGLPLAITHSPGCMFLTDLPEAQFLVPNRPE